MHYTEESAHQPNSAQITVGERPMPYVGAEFVFPHPGTGAHLKGRIDIIRVLTPEEILRARELTIDPLAPIPDHYVEFTVL